MQPDYKNIAIEYNSHYSNLKQRLDLASRSLDTIDYDIQLHLHYQSGLKAIVEKYQDHKIDEAFQFIASDASNKQLIQQMLITDIAHARAEFSEEIKKLQTDLHNVAKTKVDLESNLQEAYQKRQQAQTFLLSVQRIYERKISTLDILSHDLDTRIGHIKFIKDLGDRKYSAMKEFETATNEYNALYQQSVVKLNNAVESLKSLESETAIKIRDIFSKIIVAQISAIRNNQYDLESISKYIEKVDFTKIKTVFPFRENTYQSLSPDPYYSYLSRSVNSMVIKYNLAPEQPIPPLNHTPLTEEQQNHVNNCCQLLCAQDGYKKNIELHQQIVAIEQSIDSTNSTPYTNQFASKIKAPMAVSKQTYHAFCQLFNKLLNCALKDGETIYKIQRISNLLYIPNDNPKQDNATVFNIVSQHEIFQKMYEYWEWLLYWQITQAVEGVQGLDKQSIVQQYFYATVQQMATLRITANFINQFLIEMASYYQIKQDQVQDIKAMLMKFIHAQNCDPTSNARYSSFDAVE